jgi:transcriptional regulator with XRE-family HTH domain
MAEPSRFTSPRDTTIGQNIALLRRSRGLQQKELAAQLQAMGHDLKNSLISRTEAGERVVRPHELRAFAEFFRVKPSDLSGDPSDDSAQHTLLPTPRTAPHAALRAPEPAPQAEPAPAAADDVAAALNRMADALEALVVEVRAGAQPSRPRLSAVGTD